MTKLICGFCNKEITKLQINLAKAFDDGLGWSHKECADKFLIEQEKRITYGKKRTEYS